MPRMTSTRSCAFLGFLAVLLPLLAGGCVARTAVNVVTLPVKALAGLADIEGLLKQGREPRLAAEVYQYVHLVKLENGRLEVRLEGQARKELASELGTALSRLTGQRWLVGISSQPGTATP